MDAFNEFKQREHKEKVRTIIREYLSQDVDDDEKLQKPDRNDVETAITGLKVVASLIESMAYKFDELSPDKDDIDAMFAVKEQLFSHVQKINKQMAYTDSSSPVTIIRRIEDHGEFAQKLFALHKDGLYDAVGMELQRHINIHQRIYG